MLAAAVAVWPAHGADAPPMRPLSPRELAPVARPAAEATPPSLHDAGAPKSASLNVLPAATDWRTLPNGLRVVVVPLDTPGIVAVQTWVGVGSGDEVQPGTTGFAHFFEHLMFHGTPTLPRRAREDRLEELGVAENAFTSRDDTVFHLLGPTESLDAMLEEEADRFAHLALTADGVRKEAGAVLGEYRKSRSDPDEILEERLWSTAFRNSPYGHPTIGLKTDILAMPGELDLARAFHATWYRPDRCILVVAGDVQPEDTFTRVAKAYESWKADPRAAPPPERPVEPPEEAERTARIAWTAGPTDPRLAMGWRVPPFAPDVVDGAALRVVAELMGARVAPLRRRLIDEQHLAWSLDVRPRTVRGPGLFELVVRARDPAGLPAVRQAIDQAVAALRQADEARVVKARTHLVRSRILGLTTPQSWAFAVGAVTRWGGDPRALDTELATLERVTAADVRRVVGRYLVPEHRTVVTLVAEGAMK